MKGKSGRWNEFHYYGFYKFSLPSELHEWLKSLRLHKYTRLLLQFSYEELISLTDSDLEAKGGRVISIWAA